jgi:hypothetical protein
MGTLKNENILINSFWGLEKTSNLPPNMIMTGPLMKDSKFLME